MGRGRPPLPEGEARTEMLTIRITPDELAELEKAAAKRNCSVSDLCRERLVNDSKYLRELDAHSKRLAARVNDAELKLRRIGL